MGCPIVHMIGILGRDKVAFPPKRWAIIGEVGKFFVGLETKSAYGRNGGIHIAGMIEQVFVTRYRSNVTTQFEAWPLNQSIGDMFVVGGMVKLGLPSVRLGMPFPIPFGINAEFEVGFDTGFRSGDCERHWEGGTLFGQFTSFFVSQIPDMGPSPYQDHRRGRDVVQCRSCLEGKFGENASVYII